MKDIKYILYNPCGNDTALVIGKDYTKDEKKIINDKIMEKHKNIEQVGFVDEENNNLIMAGGEFCGNATRSATYYYLKGEYGNIQIKVSGTSGVLNAGVTKEKEAWVQMPLYNGIDMFEKLDENIYKIKLEGITHIIIEEKESLKYLNIIKKDKEQIKKISKEIIDKYKIDDSAVGVMFLESIQNVIKLHPIVWVKAVDTLFYETACGSGTAAVAIYKTIKDDKEIDIPIMQPSEKIITVKTEYRNKKIYKTIISGKVYTDWNIYTL